MKISELINSDVFGLKTDLSAISQNITKESLDKIIYKIILIADNYKNIINLSTITNIDDLLLPNEYNLQDFFNHLPETSIISLETTKEIWPENKKGHVYILTGKEINGYLSFILGIWTSIDGAVYLLFDGLDIPYFYIPLTSMFTPALLIDGTINGVQNINTCTITGNLTANSTINSKTKIFTVNTPQKSSVNFDGMMCKTSKGTAIISGDVDGNFYVEPVEELSQDDKIYFTITYCCLGHY